MYLLLEKVDFHCYVRLPEGTFLGFPPEAHFQRLRCPKAFPQLPSPEKRIPGSKYQPGPTNGTEAGDPRGVCFPGGVKVAKLQHRTQGLKVVEIPCGVVSGWV